MLFYFPQSGMEINNFKTITDKTQHLSSEVMFTEIKVISFSRQEQVYLSKRNMSSQTALPQTIREIMKTPTSLLGFHRPQ